jgi:hypothetical protein
LFVIPVWDSRALGPDVMEDESGDEESEKDSDDTIADVIEIGIGRESLENTEKESERRGATSSFPP